MRQKKIFGTAKGTPRELLLVKQEIEYQIAKIDILEKYNP